LKTSEKKVRYLTESLKFLDSLEGLREFHAKEHGTIFIYSPVLLSQSLRRLCALNDEA
jgi:hypothetical protein